MSLYGNRDQKSDAPKYETSNYGVDVFAVDAAEAAAAGVKAPGWVRVKTGTGGRSGRIQYETLVAMKVQGDSVSFSDANTATIANSTGTADDVTFPDA